MIMNKNIKINNLMVDDSINDKLLKNELKT